MLHNPPGCHPLGEPNGFGLGCPRSNDPPVCHPSGESKAFGLTSPPPHVDPSGCPLVGAPKAPHVLLAISWHSPDTPYDPPGCHLSGDPKGFGLAPPLSSNTPGSRLLGEPKGFGGVDSLPRDPPVLTNPRALEVASSTPPFVEDFVDTRGSRHSASPGCHGFPPVASQIPTKDLGNFSGKQESPRPGSPKGFLGGDCPRVVVTTTSHEFSLEKGKSRMSLEFPLGNGQNPPSMGPPPPRALGSPLGEDFGQVAGQWDPPLEKGLGHVLGKSCLSQSDPPLGTLGEFSVNAESSRHMVVGALCAPCTFLEEKIPLVEFSTSSSQRDLHAHERIHDQAPRALEHGRFLDGEKMLSQVALEGHILAPENMSFGSQEFSHEFSQNVLMEVHGGTGAISAKPRASPPLGNVSASPAKNSEDLRGLASKEISLIFEGENRANFQLNPQLEPNASRSESSHTPEYAAESPPGTENETPHPAEGGNAPMLECISVERALIKKPPNLGS